MSSTAANSSSTTAPAAAATSAAQRLAWGVLFVGGPWSIARLRRYGLQNGWSDAPQGSTRRTLWRFLGALERLHKLLWLLNLLLFLRGGRYPSPLDRLLRMRLVQGSSNSTDTTTGAVSGTAAAATGSRTADGARAINYGFLDRRLLLEHFTLAAAAAAPVLRAGIALQRRAVLALRRRAATRVPWLTAASSNTTASSGSSGGCCECGAQPPQQPYVTSCGHTFCYYCLKTACRESSEYVCPQCGDQFQSSARWSAPS
jgi:peroxin-2